MARPGTAAAKKILKEVAAAHGIPPSTLLFRLRFKRVIKIKREFISKAIAEGIPKMTLAALLGLCHTTVIYHASPEMRARKMAIYHRTKPERKPWRQARRGAL